MAKGSEKKQKDSLLLTELLRQTTSLGVVSDFLKAKGVPHTMPSWDELHAKRILPAILDGTLTVDDLINLLRSVEECGRQHVFLYKCDAKHAAHTIKQETVSNALTQLGIAALLTEPKILDQPEAPTIVDVRWNGDPGESTLVVKIIEQRSFRRLLSEEVDGNKLIRTYEQTKERAVNIVLSHPDGLLEVRIGSHTNSSEYLTDIDKVLTHVAALLPEEFVPLSLTKAKQTMWDERASLASSIRFTDSTMRNDLGTVIKAASIMDGADLMNDANAVKCVGDFLKTAYCDSQNVWFTAKPPRTTRDIHVRLAGQVNEFAVPANCSANEYEYVFDRIRTLNS